MTRYLEFAVASNFSFLRGASHAEELMLQAAHVGLAGIGLCDRNTVAGVVRAHLIKREQKLALAYHPGARLVFADGTPDILAYPRDRAGWGRLCRLLTRGNLRAEKGDCILLLDDLLEHIDGLELVVMEDRDPRRGGAAAGKMEIDGCRAPCGCPRPDRSRCARAGPGQAKLKLVAVPRSLRCLRCCARPPPAACGWRRRCSIAATTAPGWPSAPTLARAAGVPLIAVNDVFHHHPDRRDLQDVLTCIREHLTIDKAGRRLAVNAERYLKPPEEMARLFRDAPEAIEETLRLDAALTFSLDELRYEYPEEMRAGFATPQDALVHLAWDGAAARYPEGIPDKVRADPRA